MLCQPTFNELMYIDDVSLKYNGANLGVSDQDIMSISIYPNPTSDFISIKGVENINSIKVYSILGSFRKRSFQYQPNRYFRTFIWYSFD